MIRVTTQIGATLGFLALFTSPPAAHAVDGVVLINQSTSLNGLPGCAPAAGVLILICQPGSYRLSGNLTISDLSTTAIQITASKVSLDLNGFAIAGPATCKAGTYPVQCSTRVNGYGIVSESDFISVFNGTVSGMGGGLRLVGSGNLVEHIRAEQNAGLADNDVASGIQVYNGIITECTAVANAGDGIIGFGLSVIALNSVSYNGGHGINSAGMASENTVIANGENGLYNVYGAFKNMSLGNVNFGIVSAVGYFGNVILGNNNGTVASSENMGLNGCNRQPACP